MQREPLLAGFVKEIGAGLDEIHSLRIDADDSMWVVAGATNTIVKLRSRRSDPVAIRRARSVGGLSNGSDESPPISPPIDPATCS